MKNKVCRLFIILIFFSSSLYSEIKITDFSFTPEIGFLNGRIIENVWRATATYSNSTVTFSPTTKLSQLTWTLDNSFFFGYTINATFNNKINISFGVKNAVSHECGTMEDLDWKTESKPDHLTNYSLHTNILKDFTQINLLVGPTFKLGKNKNISINPALGIEVQHSGFEGINGWKSYESESWVVQNFEGTIITYGQSYIAPCLSVAADMIFFNFFETNINISTTPIFKLDCYDFHVKKNAIYNDQIKNAWKFSADISLLYIIDKHNKIGLKAGLSGFPEAYGFTYINSSTDFDHSSLGGTNRFLWTYSLVYTFYF